MYADEVMTAKQFNAPVTWCIMNSFSLGWIKYDQMLAHGDRHIGVDFTEQPEFAKVAEAYGCYGQSVDSGDNVQITLKEAMKANREVEPPVKVCVS